MKKLLTLLLCLALTGCAASPNTTPPASSPEEDTTQRVEIVEVGGQTVVVDETLEQSELTQEDFTYDPGTGRIDCKKDGTLAGIDVSSHQGEIDWAAVAGDYIDFAILRIGVRGYSGGRVRADERFEENYAGCVENGIEVGCYFFSQAISVEEAIEEADFLLEILDGRELDLPVVYDWEEISGDTARTDHVDKATVTACALAFCQRIEEAGYDAMIYCNSSVGYLRYDMAQLEEIDFWFAQYESEWPSFVYDFAMWQYSCTGDVAGIKGNVDLNIWFPET